MKILVDNGHGVDCKGKCSPDGRIKEYNWAREIATGIVKCLKCKGYDVELLTPEENDVPISTRVARANTWCRKLGSKNVILVSVHINAAGSDGKWHTANGWSVFCSKNASENSKRLAKIMTEMAQQKDFLGNRSIPADDYWTWSWTKSDIEILKNTNCPAVLTENFFQDNKDDVEFLLSEEGKSKVINLHVESIITYIN